MRLSLGAGGCASIQPPDGGPPDVAPPSLRRWKVHARPDGHLQYKLFWNEYLQSVESPTALWYNPTSTDSVDRGRVRLRGKRLIVILPHTATQLWLGPGIKDFTAGNPLPLQVIPADSHCVRVRLHPAPSVKHPVWLVLEAEGGYYRFMAQGDSIRICGVSAAATQGAYAWEDKDGDALWRSSEEALWLPSPAGSVWVQAMLDTVGPRPKQVLQWGPYVILKFLEPVVSDERPLAENLWLVRGDSATFGDSVGFCRIWRKADEARDTIGPVLGWSWMENSYQPLVVLSVLDTVERDTFFHLVAKGRDTLVSGCSEAWRWHLPRGRGSATLGYLDGRRGPMIPLAKVRTVFTGEVEWIYVYTPSVLENATRLLVRVGDTLWLPPGTYGVRPGSPAEGPAVVIEAGVPRLASYRPPIRLVEIPEVDSTLVVPVEVE